MKETDDVGDTEKSYTWTTEEYGDLVSEYGDGDSSYYEYDALGNTAALLDPAQTSTDKFLYRAFGKLEARSGESDVDHTFVGKQGYLYNAESELYLLGTGGSGGASSSARTSSTIGRYYDADVGQFLTQDPARTPEKNLYRYVDNNPVNQVDPSGQAVGSADVFEDQFNWYSDWHDRNYQRDTHKLIHVERPYSEHLLFYDAKSVRLASGGKCNHFVYKYVGDTSWYRKPFSSNSFARTLRLKGGQEVRTIVKARVIRDAVDDQAWGEVDDLVKK